MNQNKLTIGLIGFGVVGEGVYKVLQRTPSLQANIKKVCVKDSTKKETHRNNCLPQMLTAF